MISGTNALSRLAATVLLALGLASTIAAARATAELAGPALTNQAETVTVYTLTKAIDGQIDGVHEAWSQVNLGAVYPISAVTVSSLLADGSSPGAPGKYHVFVSKQPLPTSAPVTELSEIPGIWAIHHTNPTGLTVQIPVPGNVVGQYVRLQVPEQNPSALARMEVQSPRPPHIYLADPYWKGDRAGSPAASAPGRPYVLRPPSPSDLKGEEMEFDRIVRYYNWPNLTIHYAPGVYLTHGAVWNHTGPGGGLVRIATAFPGVKHAGAGRDQTIIRLQATLRGELNNGSPSHEEAKYIFDSSGLTDCDGFELRDLTLDCNGRTIIDTLEASYPHARALIGGARTSGNNIAYVNVKVIGFGCTSGPANPQWPAKGAVPGPECFPLAISKPNARSAVHDHMEGCVITQPGTSMNYSDGLTALSLYIPPKWDGHSYVSNCVVADLNVPKKSDRVTPSFSYSHGFAGNRCLNSTFINSGVGGAVYYEIDEGFDFPNGDFLIQGNTFVDCPSGVKINWVSRKNPDGSWKPSVLGRLSVAGNIFYLNPAETAHAMWCYDDEHGVSGNKVNDLTIQNNTVTYRGDGPGYSGGACAERFNQKGPLHQGFVLARFVRLSLVNNQFYLGYKRANPSQFHPGEPDNNEILIDQRDRGHSVFKSATIFGNYNHCQATIARLYAAEYPYAVRYYNDPLWNAYPERRPPQLLGTQLTKPW